MVWGTFGVTHFMTLVFGAAFSVGLYWLVKYMSPFWQTAVLGVLSFAGIGAVIYNLLAWNSPLEYLPFHLCSITALVLPFAVFTRSKVLGNLLLLWSLGALFAVIVNYAMAEAELLSWPFFFYFVPHVLEFAIPLILLKLGRFKLSWKCILSTVGITVLAYTVIHFANIGINAYCTANNILTPSGDLTQVNYMYSLRPENPLLQLFWDIIPYPYWYMFVAVPIAALYLCGLNGIKALIKKIKEA